MADGGTPPRSDPSNFGHTVPWAVVSDVRRRISATKESLSEKGLQASSARLWPEGTVIVTTGATIGEVGVAEIPLATKQGITGIIADRAKVVPDFLAESLIAGRGTLERFSQGSTFSEIRVPTLSRLQIPHPISIGEQQRIAEILSTVDETIEQTEKLIAKHQQIKAGLMHDLFTRGLTPDGRLRPPHSDAPHLYKDSPLGPIPGAWDVRQAGTLFSIQLGKMLSRASKTGSAPAPYLANRNVQWERVDVAELEWMDFSAAERERFSLRERDILVCEGGEVGRTALWRSEIEQCFYQKAIHRLRPLASEVSPEFFMWYMQLAVRSPVLRKLSSQTSIAHLTREKLALLPVPLPTRDEQDAIAQCLALVSDLIGAEQQRAEKFTRQKQGLMHDLLTGAVPVPIPEAADDG